MSLRLAKVLFSTLFVSCIVVVCTVCCLANAENTQFEVEVLKPDMKGADVCRLQECLNLLGYPVGLVDGVYGRYTEDAVRQFQKNHGLVADGIVGPETFAKIQECFGMYEEREYIVKSGDSVWSICRRFDISMDVLVQLNNLTNPEKIKVGQKLRIPVDGFQQKAPEMIAWERVNQILPSIIRIIDTKTGLSFYVKRRGGYYHADFEPLTKEDTKIMKTIYGGQWSWERRAIIVEACGMRIAASMNGMPHGGENIVDNNFDGHFCVHFLGSKLHKNGLSDASHQMMVRLAASY